MFVAIYKFKLKEEQEAAYRHHWHKVATYFIKEKEALGSCLHKGENNLWVAYSRWPNKATRDAAWSDEALSNGKFPKDIYHSIQVMQGFKKENAAWQAHYEELCLTVVDDLLKREDDCNMFPQPVDTSQEAKEHLNALNKTCKVGDVISPIDALWNAEK